MFSFEPDKLGASGTSSVGCGLLGETEERNGDAEE